MGQKSRSKILAPNMDYSRNPQLNPTPERAGVFLQWRGQAARVKQQSMANQFF